MKEYREIHIIKIWISKNYIYITDMISGSETLVEFQSLCQILEINPQVYKQKHPAKQPSGMYVNLQ